MSEVFTGTVDVVRLNLPDEVVILARGLPGLGDTVPTVRIIRLNAETGEVLIGGPARSGTLRLLNASLLETATLDATFGNLRLGGNGADGDILLFASGGDRNNNGAATIHLDGEAGDILLRNGDCAEDFEVASPDDIKAGNVLVLAQDGRLVLAQEPYDRKVAGIVSGAGDTRPGIVLARAPGQKNRLPVALAGRVNCWVDASYGSVAAGDLLTTSATPGHAMAAADPVRAFGSVIGKAIRPLDAGRALIPVLVALQ